MFFKNKVTGLTWEVVHPDHIKRCKNDPDYEEVKLKQKKDSNDKQVKDEKPKQSKKKPVQK